MWDTKEAGANLLGLFGGPDESSPHGLPLPLRLLEHVARQTILPQILPPFLEPMINGARELISPEKPPPSGYHNADPALAPIRAALNDPSLSHEKRAQLMLDYRNAEAGRMSASADTAWAMQEMLSAKPGAPVNLGGPHKGAQLPLFEKLGKSEDMQKMLAGLADQINGADPKELDINKLFEKMQKEATDLHGGKAGGEENLMAMQAMATLVNAKKFAAKDGKLPPELEGKVDAELFKKINTACLTLEASTSAKAAVMGHDQTDGNAFDNNAHFFTHAYVTGSLIKEYGLSEKDAQAMSGMIGAQYELIPSSIGEGSGNAGLKDILMNSEGAAFGAGLMKDPGRKLPGAFDGPPPEMRSNKGPAFQDIDEDALPPSVKSIADQAASKASLFMHWVL